MLKEQYLEALPVAPLKIIAMDNCIELGNQIDSAIAGFRKQFAQKNEMLSGISGYVCDSYKAGYHMDAILTGERQAVIEESIRGTDLFIITDVVNRNISDNVGYNTFKTPDEHFQDLKRIISACHGSAKRINLIMPYLYQGRFTSRRNLESLDCAIALKNMIRMGISNIITFDAHEPRIQNAVPIQGIDNFPTSFQFLEAIINGNEGLSFNKDKLHIVSPDIGGMGRVVFYSSILGVDMGMFYIRKDYSTTVHGEHPVVAVEFLGGDIAGKDVIIVDDMIASGGSMLDVAKQLKERKAGRVFVCTTFGLFTEGFEKFDEYYEKGYINKVITTNLTYLPAELYKKPYFVKADMSKFLALIIDSLNHDITIGAVMNPTDKIHALLEKYARGEQI